MNPLHIYKQTSEVEEKAVCLSEGENAEAFYLRRPVQREKKRERECRKFEQGRLWKKKKRKPTRLQKKG